MSRIIVDAGHGGRDPGAVGPTGLQESVVNLQVAEKLAELLTAQRYSVRMTRNTDVFVEISARTRAANEWHANYFVSIHCNGHTSNASGIETLYKSNAGKQLAEPVQNLLIAATTEINRGLKHRTDLGVLNSTNMPAILIEIGFITHRPTEDKFRTNEYLQIIADAIHAGIVEFLGDTPTAPATLPPIPAKPRVDITVNGPVDIFINGKHYD